MAIFRHKWIFDWFFNPKCEAAISHVFTSFNFAKMAKIWEIAKFNLVKINPIKFLVKKKSIKYTRKSVKKFSQIRFASGKICERVLKTKGEILVPTPQKLITYHRIFPR